MSAVGLQAEGRPAPGGQDTTEETHFWLIEPAAEPDASWWQGRPIWQLAVAAPSAAVARVTAENWARRRGPIDIPHIGNESPSDNAGFGDVRLYRVRPLPEAEGVISQWPTGDSVVVLAGPLKPGGAA